MKPYELFENKSDCCGCGACMNICSKNAISMDKDEYGFIYPHINSNLCIQCGMCEKVCAYQNIKENNEPMSVYAAVTKNTDIMKSASGGAFASIAAHILDNGGVVYGSSMETVSDNLLPMHIRVNNREELLKLMGSKYVQSNMGNTYLDIKKDLKSGKQVLFSGTPCQVASLKGFLQKQYDNLYTVDIVCHGVPSSQLFQDYLSVFENKLDGKITEFLFRDKKVGWGLTAKVTYIRDNKERYKWIPSGASSYYTAFLNSDIYRENCYSCKYAGKNRPGDLTVGDYWGIEKVHPEYLSKNDGFINVGKGSSCIIVNSQNGANLIDECIDYLTFKPSSYEKAAKENGQLTHPSVKGKNRDLILDSYKSGGYEAVEKMFRKTGSMNIITANCKFLVKSILHYLKLR